MAKKRALTPLQKEYKKQRKRIQSFLSKARKRGYEFAENALPKIPKTIKPESVERLRKITPEKLYKKAYYGGELSYGEKVPASEGLKLEKQARSRKAAETRKKSKQKYPKPEEPKKKRKEKVNEDRSFFTRAVIGTFLYTLETCRNGKAYPLLKQWFEKLRKDNGDENVAEMLKGAAQNDYELTWEVVYDAEKATDFTRGIIQYLSTQGDFYRDEMEEYWNFMSRLENEMYEDSNFISYD